MAFCAKCGSAAADGVAFCPQCGAPIGAPGSVAGGAAVAATPVVSGISENLAGLLCYLLGWVTGIIFLIIDKRPFVRFHAAQSIAVFGVLFVIRIVLSFGILGTGAFGSYALWALVSLVVSLITLVAWIALMVMAYQGKRYVVPGVAGITNSIAGSKSV